MLRNKKCFWQIIRVLGVAGCMWCCGKKQETLFELIPSSHSNVKFVNTITESDSLNVLRFDYIYNGAGVGIGDFNNDGLSDIFFAGNMVSSKLYLNEGNFKFRDVSVRAGVATKAWCTGVSVIDINQDGLLDVYVSTAHYDINKSAPNILFINKGIDQEGIPTFVERAKEVGLADESYSTQGVFFDYDLDGDLDMYLLTNALESYNRSIVVGPSRGSKKSVDKLFRNDQPKIGGLPVFKDVSSDAGIVEEGWGLGITVADINNDGYPDIYVANDFQSNDLLYINNKNGTFTNRIETYLRHQSQNSMGMDIADINNDGKDDIAVVDMMPEDNLRQKTMFPRIEYDKFRLTLEKKYQPQYVRNVLQLNNGNNTFSDIGYLSGIYATDWSWSALFADFDNDGFRDLLISNGYKKDVTNLDFVSYRKESTMFGTKQTRDGIILNSLKDLPGVKKPKFLFHNNHDLTFTDKGAAWGLSKPSYSNGVAYADLDNDGDLDLVMNNIDEEAFIYQSHLNDSAATNRHHYLRIHLVGNQGNTHGVGAKILIYYNGKFQFDEHKLQRGYKTTVEPTVHFGLGSEKKIDSLVVTWPGAKKQKLTGVAVDQLLTLKQADASERYGYKAEGVKTMVRDVSRTINIESGSKEDDYPDFKIQRLLTQKYSQGGPAISVGDVNGDGKDDIVTGAPKGKATRIFLQKKDGTFSLSDSLEKKQEDMGLLLFDADTDGDLDLYSVSGSSEFGGDVNAYQHRFYRNNGKGKFKSDSSALLPVNGSGCTVRACDIDRDGDLDLFVGGRISPGNYPMPPESYLLINDGKGNFENGTASKGNDLQKVGMVTDALWTDFDNDGWIDLMVVGEFMPVTFFKNIKGSLERLTISRDPFEYAGFWNSLAAGDFDNDGDTDYVAGNLGLNSFFKATDTAPLTLYAKDYDKNGSIDPVLTHFNNGKEYPVHYRETLIDQMPFLKKMLNRYDIYGNATFSDIFHGDLLKDAFVLKATYLASAYIENAGNGKFVFHKLPVECQFAPVFGMLSTDVDEDGHLDILTVGNSYASETLSGWYDGGIGTFLKGNGKGRFESVSARESGFTVMKDAKAFVQLARPGLSSLYIVSQNQDSVKVFENAATQNIQAVRVLVGDTYAELILKDGSKRREEFYYGNGYLSQSSRVLYLPLGVVSATIYDVSGTGRRVR